MSLVEVEGYASLERGVCRVIAEAGANHNNSVEQAIEMAERAARAGAWAIKFQLYKAETISTRESPKYWHDAIGTATQFEAFRRSDRLDYAAYGAVAEACRELGLVFFATPFDFRAIDALEEMHVPLYKIASGDITYEQLIRAVGATGKPVLLSTGASTEEEIERAIDWSGLGPDKLVVLVCTLAYPTEDEDAHFARITAFKERFLPYLIGVSDHTLGVAGGWLAGALGAVCLEKHYTLDKSLPDVPDHRISVAPPELAELVAACDRAATLRGDPDIAVQPAEEPARRDARRSIVSLRDLKAGVAIAPDDLGFKRPGTGLPPNAVDSVVGRRTRRTIEADRILSEEDLV